MAAEYDATELPQEKEVEDTVGGLWLYVRKDINEAMVSGHEDSVELAV